MPSLNRYAFYMQDDLPNIKKQVEIDLLNILADLLEKGEINKQFSKEVAQYYLSLLPFASEEDMEQKLKQFSAKYPTLEKAYIMALTYIEEDKTKELIERLRTYISHTE